jgi:hypothetical protein
MEMSKPKCGKSKRAISHGRLCADRKRSFIWNSLSIFEPQRSQMPRASETTIGGSSARRFSFFVGIFALQWR